MESLEGFKVREDVRQSPEYGRYMERIGWKTVPLGGGQGFVKKLGPVSIAKIQRVPEIPWAELESMLSEERAMMCKIEPLSYEPGMVDHGYKRDSWPLVGTKTLRVNLRPKIENILAGFTKDCRYTLRKIVNTGYKVQTNEFGNFYNIWQKSAKRKDLWIPNENSYQALVEEFGDKCFCLTAGNEAGTLILMHKQTAFYYYAGATGEGNRLNLPYRVVWEAMQEAKRRGCVVWDFEGIYDSRWPNKGWRGFSKFKLKFGGQQVEFPGCFTKWRWPF